MAQNPYTRYTEDDLKEEITREENERSRLQKELDKTNEELADTKRGRSKERLVARGREYPVAVYRIARDYSDGRITRETYYSRMRRHGITPGPALGVVGAVERAETEFEITVEVDQEKVSRLEREIEEKQTKIQEISWELTLKHEAEERGFKRVDITKYFTYDEPGGTQHLQSPRVRFEIRAELTIPRHFEITAEWLEDRVEPIFDRAFEELGKNRRQASPLNEDEYRQYRSGKKRREGWSPQRIGRRYYLVGPPTEGNYINPDAFRKEIQVEGVEEMGTTESFQSIINFKVEKYKLPANTHAGTWFISFSITEGQLG